MSRGQVRRPTLDDVATAMGVSRATVSNAYNRPDQLSEGLREDVLRTAKSLGYPGPNPTARSLARQRAGAIAFMLDTALSEAFSTPALSLTLDAFATEVDAEEYSLLLLRGGGDGGPSPARILNAQADLFVAYSLGDGAPALETVRSRGLPLVVIDHPAVADAALVGTDDRTGAAAAARHLLELGHRSFGILSAQCLSTPRGGPLTAEQALDSRFQDNRERLAGYLDTLRAAGVSPEGVPIWETSGTSRERMLESAGRLLDSDPRPTALLCMSDDLALAAIGAAKQRGLTVPADLSVVGFDDIPGASWAEPALTTIRQDLATKGKLAGQFALAMLAGEPPPAHRVLPVELVVRDSTGPVPGYRSPV